MNQKFVTFRTEDCDDIQVLHVSDFTSHENFDEWVWHLAPDQAAAVARHDEAFDTFMEDDHEYFDHSNPPPGWSHIFDINIEITSRRNDGSDVTGAQIRAEIDKLTDSELRYRVNLVDTIREE